MHVRLGLVVPVEARALFQRGLEGLSGVQPRWAVYHDESSIAATVERILPECDALCFAGRLSLERARAVLPAELPYVEVSPTPVDIAMSFLRARALGMEITPVSIDSVPLEMVTEILAELGLSGDLAAVLPFDNDLSPEEIAEFHREQREAIGARYVMTARNAVFRVLDGQHDVPVVRVLTTVSTITATVRELSLRAASMREGDLRLAAAVFRACADGPDDAVAAGPAGGSPAERIAALLTTAPGWRNTWVDVRSDSEVAVIGHKRLMDEMTHQWRSLGLLGELRQRTGGRVVAGFGLGESTQECLYYATQAVQRADATRTACAYLMTEQGVVVGPMVNEGQRPTRFRFKSDDAALERLSRRTGLGVTTLTQLIELEERLAGGSITADELGMSLNVTATSGRRIIRALREGGMVTHVGQSQPATRGRPRYLYRMQVRRHLEAGAGRGAVRPSTTTREEGSA